MFSESLKEPPYGTGFVVSSLRLQRQHLSMRIIKMIQGVGNSANFDKEYTPPKN